MKTCINRLMDAAHKYTAMDFAILKIYLVSVGILLGCYFNEFFARYISFIWILALFTLLGVIFITYNRMKNNKNK